MAGGDEHVADTGRGPAIGIRGRRSPDTDDLDPVDFPDHHPRMRGHPGLAFDQYGGIDAPGMNVTVGDLCRHRDRQTSADPSAIEHLHDLARWSALLVRST
jgi:hypothetical protein